MRIVFRLSLGVGLLGMLVVGGSYGCPAWSARLGLDPAEWLGAQWRLEQEHRRGEVLDRQRRQTLQNLETEMRAIKDLADGRLTLLAAAARFRALDHPGMRHPLEFLRRSFPGRTDEERWCRRVLAFLRASVSSRPDLTARADQLEAELIQLLARGPLHLRGRTELLAEDRGHDQRPSVP